MNFADLPPEAAACLAVLWVTAAGGAIGSFLNVVVYRVPAGLSISRPPSHCPKCKHPIRWYDNVPVFGWLSLRGRCRHCGTRIPMRYPAVEALCAAMFLLLAAVAWQTGGENLPVRPVAVAGGAIAPDPTLGHIGSLYVYHLLLLCTLLAAGLIEYDGHGLPTRLFTPALVIGLAAPLAWPWLHPLPAWGVGEGVAAALVDGLAGLAAGGAMGLLVNLLAGPKRPTGLWLAPACVGLFLGWQAAVVLGGATCLAAVVRRIVGRGVPMIGVLWLLAVVWIVAWRPILATWGRIG